jgi:hypothetical protein
VRVYSGAVPGVGWASRGDFLRAASDFSRAVDDVSRAVDDFSRAVDDVSWKARDFLRAVNESLCKIYSRLPSIMGGGSLPSR